MCLLNFASKFTGVRGLLTNTANVQLRELCPDLEIDSLLDMFSNVENLQQKQ
jgi:hypothetical protein